MQFDPAIVNCFDVSPSQMSTNASLFSSTKSSSNSQTKSPSHKPTQQQYFDKMESISGIPRSHSWSFSY